MRHEDAGLALWVAADAAARDREGDSYEARLIAQRSTARSMRRRLGAAFIALGERLAGESRPVTRRRLAGQAS
jgi:hypothetical protein